MSLLTTNQITREAVRLFVNSNNFIKNIDRQYDDQFAVEGAKIGDTLRIRLPNDYVVTDGPALSAQDTDEQNTTLTISTQRHVDTAFSSKDRTMDLDDYSERILAPKINNLAGDVAREIAEGSEGGISNFVANTAADGTILVPKVDTFLDSKAILEENSVPAGMRKMILSPRTEAKTVSVLSGLLNDPQNISRQFRTGEMKQGLGFDWFMDQTVINHTTGSFSAGTVNGANQTGTSLLTSAITGTLAKGDIITVAGVNSVNRVNKMDTGVNRQFVMTAAAANGATSLSIYPAITPPVGGVDVQYQTVTASPANGAAITMAHPASTTYRRNFSYCPDAVTMGTADLVMPKGVHEVSRKVFDGVSMRFLTDYAVGTDQLVSRLDVLFGYTWIRPEWACIVADQI